MKVSFKIGGEAITQNVETIYINDGMKRVVLHFSKDANLTKLLTFSFTYKLEFYKYADDGHVGITIPLDSIYSLEYDKED